MPNYRRANVPGGSFFFTLVTDQRAPLFGDPSARLLLGNCLREAQEKWPFEVEAIVLLPDHLHAIWSLPSGDTDYSIRWAWIKKEFTKRWLSTGGTEQTVTEGRRIERRRGVWHPRFWEHTLEDEKDYEAHFDYLHYNPVKHGLVRCPHDWPHSSFHRWVKAGVYDEHWGCSDQQATNPDFTKIKSTAGE